ncbi:MAG: HEAT repeat domain-containing protein [Planctomyces sp.]|nr:HEAT repeat domain-containing protein [Planctomyces sp.]
MSHKSSDEERIDKLADRLGSEIPIIGGWLRRQAVRSLERSGCEKAVQALADAIRTGKDPIKRLAIEALQRIAIRPVCAVTQLAFDACLTFEPGPTSGADKPEFETLLNALRCTPDWPVSSARHEMCKLFVQDDDPSIRSFLVRNDITSYCPVTTMEVMFLAGRFDAPFDRGISVGHGLTASGIGWPSYGPVHQRIADTAIRHGSLRWAELIVQAPERLGERHWDAAIQILRKANRFEQIWKLLRFMSPIRAAETLDFLDESRWRPAGNEGSEYDTLLQLARNWQNRREPVIGPTLAIPEGWERPADNTEVHVAADFILVTDRHSRLSGEVLKLETLRNDGITISQEYVATTSSPPCVVSDDMRWLIHGDQTGTVTVRELPSLAIRTQKQVLPIGIKNLAISSEPALLAIRGPLSRNIVLLNVPDLTTYSTLKSSMTSQRTATVEHLAFSVDRSAIACWTADPKLNSYSLAGNTVGFRCQLWDLVNGRPRPTDATHIKHFGMGSDWSAGWKWPTSITTIGNARIELRETHDSMATECVTRNQLWRAKVIEGAVQIRRDSDATSPVGSSVEGSFDKLVVAGELNRHSIQRIAWTHDNRLLVLTSKSFSVVTVGLQHAGIEVLKSLVPDAQRSLLLVPGSKQRYSHECRGLEFMSVFWETSTTARPTAQPPEISRTLLDNDSQQESTSKLISALLEELTEPTSGGTELQKKLDKLTPFALQFPVLVVAGSLNCLEQERLPYDDAEIVRKWLVGLGPIALPGMLATVGGDGRVAESVVRQLSQDEASKALKSVSSIEVMKSLWAIAQSEAFDDEFKASQWWQISVAKSYMDGLKEMHIQNLWQRMCDGSIFEKWTRDEERESDPRVFRFLAEWSNRCPDLWNPFLASVSVRHRALLIGVFPRLGELQNMDRRDSSSSVVQYYDLAPPWIVKGEPSLVPELFRQLFAIHVHPGLLEEEYGFATLCRCLSEMHEKWVPGFRKLSTRSLMKFLKRIPSRSKAEELFRSGSNRMSWIDTDDFLMALLAAIERREDADAQEARTLYDTVLQKWAEIPVDDDWDTLRHTDSDD